MNSVKDTQKARIVDYQPEYQEAFKTINEEWIATYFQLEEEDRKLLNDPTKYIIDNGGAILIAIIQDEPVGTCALIPMDDPLYKLELGKMGVLPKARGKGVGELLGRAIIQKAKELGAETVYLESNSILQPAINLYRKLGFKEVTNHQSPYSRCNIQMAINISET